MAFWRRIKQSRIDTKLWNQFTRSIYIQNHSPIIIPNPTKILFQSYPLQKPQFDFSTNVRFFAAPVQAKTKKEEKDTSGPRLNEQITADVLRLVTDEGHSVLSRHEALKLARSLKLDLVEVQRNAKPPVCKLMEYHREKYKQELKEKDRAKKKSEVTLRKGACKEVRFTGKITQNDLQIKADMAKRLMERGYRVKCVAIGNGHLENGEDSATLLSRFSALIEDMSTVESDTRVEEKDQAHVIIRHVKYGPLKKGSGKKAPGQKKSARASVQEVESDDDAVFSEEMTDADAEEKEKSGWKVLDASDDFDKLFDIKDNPDDISKSSRNEKLSNARETRSSSVGGSSDHASPGGRDTSQSVPVPQFSQTVRQPQINMNASPERRETERGDSPTPSYGIFSAQERNNAPGKHGIPGEANRYKLRIASNSRRDFSPPRPMGHANGDVSNS